MKHPYFFRTKNIMWLLTFCSWIKWTVQPLRLLVWQPVQRSTVTLGLSMTDFAIFANKLFSSLNNLSSFEFTATLETGWNLGSTSCMNVQNQLCSTTEIANPPFLHNFITMEVRILSWFLKGSLVLGMNVPSLLKSCWVTDISLACSSLWSRNLLGWVVSRCW